MTEPFSQPQSNLYGGAISVAAANVFAIFPIKIRVTWQQSRVRANKQQRSNFNTNFCILLNIILKEMFFFLSDQLCNCPQKCGEKIPQELRERLFAVFYKMGDHLQQNYFLQSYIEMRSVHKRLYQEETRVGGRLQRRVSCKYRIPLEIPTSYFSEKLSAQDLKSEL